MTTAWFPDECTQSPRLPKASTVPERRRTLRRFLCPSCGDEVHFGNGQCLRCSSDLAYLPSQDAILAAPAGNSLENRFAPGTRTCGNRSLIGCNWLCERESFELCLSCRHTTKIPDISGDANRDLWAKLERAKRRLIYGIIKFKLPLESGADGRSGFLHFEFLGDEISPDGSEARILTGHANGKITINIAEADDAHREKTRTEMGEPYRTLIGHLRHEVGHYYWQKLIAGQPAIEDFRTAFGDERADYSEALKAHYAKGPRPDWPNFYVTAYAAAHPWEDFAETWAHYFHMVAGLETAYAYGLNPQPLSADQPRMVQFEDPYHVLYAADLVDHWIPLTVAMNAMNRAIGNHDFYPFVLTPATLAKLKFVHDLIAANEVPFAH